MENKNEKMVSYLGFGIGGALIALSIPLYFLHMSLFLNYMDFVVLGVTMIMLLPGLYDYMYQKKIKRIEDRLPDFLRDVAEAGRFGMTLAEAIIVASSGRYGPLTDEIKRMAAKIEWGVPVKEALESFNERVKTPLVDRMVAIVIKANVAGGNVADVLGMVAHAARETQLMEKERSIEMSTYAFVLVTAFFVFVATVIILNNSFLPQMAKAGRAVEASLKTTAVSSNIPVSIAYQNVPIIRFLFVMATLIHGIGDGVMMGILRDGRLKGGMLWGSLLLVSGYFMLKFTGAT